VFIMQYLGKHAVVIGASVSGMLAARVLADFFEKVTIIERDPPPGSTSTRKGVPQRNHSHVMLKRGEKIIEDLFPNIYKNMAVEKEIPLANANNTSWFHFGVWKLRIQKDYEVRLVSRALLEQGIYVELQKQHPNIHFMFSAKVKGLIRDTKNKRDTIRGIHIITNIDKESIMHCDFIVDASGRNTKISDWLSSLGFEKPTETEIPIHMGYASRIYHRKEGMDWEALAIYPTPPIGKRMGYIFPIEGDRWMVTLAGCMKDYPNNVPDEFLHFSKGLENPTLFHVIKDAEPLTDIITYRFPSNLRRYFERLRIIPENLIVVGDALCSFNPIYGQGMSVAAMEAELLRNCLSKGELTDFSKLYFRKVSKIINNPWLAAVSEDLRYAEKGDKRATLSLRILNWYKTHLFILSSTNERVASIFYDVQHLLKSPLSLFEPHIMTSILIKALKTKFKKNDKGVNINTFD